MCVLLLGLCLSSCKTTIHDRPVCQTDPIYYNGFCTWMFSKHTYRIPKKEWNRKFQNGDLVAIPIEHWFGVLKDLRNACFQDNIACKAYEKMKGMAE